MGEALFLLQFNRRFFKTAKFITFLLGRRQFFIVGNKEVIMQSIGIIMTGGGRGVASIHGHDCNHCENRDHCSIRELLGTSSPLSLLVELLGLSIPESDDGISISINDKGDNRPIMIAIEEELISTRIVIYPNGDVLGKKTGYFFEEVMTSTLSPAISNAFQDVAKHIAEKGKKQEELTALRKEEETILQRCDNQLGIAQTKLHLAFPQCFTDDDLMIVTAKKFPATQYRLAVNGIEKSDVIDQELAKSIFSTQEMCTLAEEDIEKRIATVETWLKTTADLETQFKREALNILHEEMPEIYNAIHTIINTNSDDTTILLLNPIDETFTTLPEKEAKLIAAAYEAKGKDVPPAILATLYPAEQGKHPGLFGSNPIIVYI